MFTFNREIFPIGQGGFAFEHIEDYSIVFDCGSKTCPTRVSHYIEGLRSKVKDKVDTLYISHFDIDHVNSLQELIIKIGVKEVIIPYIPEEFRVIYNILTSGAYFIIRSIIEKTNDKVNEKINLVEDSYYIKKYNGWLWVSMTAMTNSDWNRFKEELILQGISTHQLHNPQYVDNKKNIINKSFKSVFGSQGPNSKGLLLLSQNINGTILSNELIEGDNLHQVQGSAALYTGDANMINLSNVEYYKSFLQTHLRSKLILLQIPHHGSCYSSGRHFDRDFPADYYYFHDKSSVRLQKNSVLYNTLITNHLLLQVRDIDSDLIRHSITIK